MDLARRVINKMYDDDSFSQWLGIEILEASKGKCKLKMKIRKEMTNGFSIAHGGISYSLADTALAFSANSHGIQSMSIETSISHTNKIMEGDTLIADVKELTLSNKIGIYLISIINQNDKEIAHFKGTVYRTGKKWFDK